MPYCFNCNVYDKEMETVCSDCSATLCIKCEIDDDVLCGCYGKCDSCGCDVNRGSDGWPCMDCREWLCNDCKNSSECDRCGRGGNGTDSETKTDDETNNDTDDANDDDANDDDANDDANDDREWKCNDCKNAPSRTCKTCGRRGIDSDDDDDTCNETNNDTDDVKNANDDDASSK